MTFNKMPAGADLSVLFTALQNHCSKFDLDRNSPAYFKASKLAMRLFEDGITTAEELEAGLQRARPSEFAASASLQQGQRVVRKKGDERGTVVEATEREIKVKWDRGATSCFRRGEQGNVLPLPPTDGSAPAPLSGGYLTDARKPENWPF